MICRCFLQNPEVGTPEIKALVDKVFTYATPHNGIDLRLIGNVPKLWFKDNADTFNRKVLGGKKILDLPGEDHDRVDYLNKKFDANRFFCLVGTDSSDYGAAKGLSKVAVGPMSDGLVQISNATVQGSPRAFIHRSHSGDYGIVNSESGYQNLVRFLFGNVRVDGTLEIEKINLPPFVQKEKDKGSKIKGSYHFECVVRTRGARWDLHRRLVKEHSAIQRTYEELFEQPKSRMPHLFSQFLSSRDWAQAKKGRKKLGFQLDLRVLVPEYTIDRKRRLDHHFDGSFLYNDRIIIEITPQTGEDIPFKVRHGFEWKTPGRVSGKFDTAIPIPGKPGEFRIEIPVVKNKKPGIKAKLVLRVRPWNPEAE